MTETDLGAVAEGGGAGAAPVAGMGPLAGMAARPTVSSVLRVALANSGCPPGDRRIAVFIATL
ncbi:hypothetical protein H7I76_15960 [Mycolicibacterium vaccae]|nr:hypothetical protein [Mycolicibacterium vaccae]